MLCVPWAILGLWIPHPLQWRALGCFNQVLLSCRAQQRGKDTFCVLWGLAEVGFAKLAKLSPGKGSVGSGLGEGTVTLHNPRWRKEESPKR